MNVEAPRTLEEVSSLWDEHNSSHSIILVLPDALQPKFYLHDVTGRRRREEARAEREAARYEFLSRKIATAERKNGRSKFTAAISKPPIHGLIERFFSSIRHFVSSVIFC